MPRSYFDLYVARSFEWLALAAAAFVIAATLVGCPAVDDVGPDSGPADAGETRPDAGGADDDDACDAAPVIRTTSAGVNFVRTPDACFEALPDWPYDPAYVELDGLRQAYVDEGPPDGPVVLLVHGQPSWSYLYRKMIPVLADAGYRVIAMDQLGMGRSDKPTDIASYSYLGHNDRLFRFIEALALEDINLFVQDWGSLVGLRVAGLHPELFARIAVGNGVLPLIPEGVEPFPAVENPNDVEDLPSLFANTPAQQVPYYDGCTLLDDDHQGDWFGVWMTYAMKGASFRPSEVLEALTWFDLPDDEAAAYDAPFPSREYMAGPRVFPSLVNELPGVNTEAWAGLTTFDRPFLTLWGNNDPGTLGACETQQRLVTSIPGAAGLPHDRIDEASHFLQDDQGAAIAERLAAFFRVNRTPLTRQTRYCELFLVRLGESGPEAEVWGTHGLGDCPQAGLDTLDLDTVASDTGALQVILNGPRHWIPNVTTTTSAAASSLQLFGELPMLRLATFAVDPSERPANYETNIVERATTYTFFAGEEVYELTSPDDTVFVMQSMSLMSDPTLTFAALPTLGARLSLPSGWSYASRTLDADLVLNADGEATVLTDDLGNTYQRQ